MRSSNESQTTAYSTEKLTFAAYLIASEKAKLLEAIPQNGSSKVTFMLSEEPTSEELSAFFSGAATVSALKYAEALSNLKGVAIEARRQRGGNSR